MQKDFENICPCDLQVYKSSAYLILDDDVRLGKLFPRNNAMDEIIVLIMTKLRKRVKNSDIKRNEDEMIILSQERVKTIIERMIKENENFLPAKYRQKNRKIFVDELYEYLLQLGFAQENDNDVIFYPIIGKLVGSYEEV